MEIITRRRRVESPVLYERRFDYAGHNGWGCRFPCDADGNIFPLTNDAAKANLADCLAGTLGIDDKGQRYLVVDKGVMSYQQRPHYEPAIGKCDCGQLVTLDYSSGSDVSTCDGCGADYNASGQRLAPRECWGEETGETAADILRGGDPFDGDY